MNDLLHFGFKEIDRSVSCQEGEYRFELRCIAGHALVAWFRVIKNNNGRYVFDIQPEFKRHESLSLDQQHAARRWLAEKFEQYTNCNRIPVTIAA